MPVKMTKAVLIVFAVCVAAVALLSFTAAGRASRTVALPADIARGKYLVNNVAMCIECHTPRDSEGNLNMQAYLQGAPIWIVPAKRIPNWANYAPVLAGLPSYTDEQMENVLERGIGANGNAIQPPMHLYHMNPEDAKAIIEYLKSLPMEKR
jgi:mono/diheme cytochrome c family protein